MQALTIPFHAGPISIVADCPQGEGLLRRLAVVLELETTDCTENIAQNAVVFLSNKPPKGEWRTWEGAVRLPAKVFWRPEEGKFHYQLEEEINYADDAPLCWRTLVRVFHQCASNRILLTDSLQMHGALLRMNDSAIILFANCGVGKSTACGRFERGGGKVLGDDKIMLHLAEDGTVYAQPAPTWSRPIFSPKMHFAFSQVLPLRGLFRLTRGKGDEIHPASAVIWHAELLQGSFNYFERPLDWADADLHRRISARNVILIDRLWKLFPPLEIAGDLNGNLYGNLSAWLNDHET